MSIEIKRISSESVEGWVNGYPVIRVENGRIGSSVAITGDLPEGLQLLDCYSQAIAEYKQMQKEAKDNAPVIFS